MSTDTIEARVARGAAWLDENEPGWERRIDLATLDLHQDCGCILGQLFGLYAKGIHIVIGTPVTECHVDCRARGAALGFYWNRGDTGDAPLLDEAWVALIKERFASGLLSDEAAS